MPARNKNSNNSLPFNKSGKGKSEVAKGKCGVSSCRIRTWLWAGHSAVPSGALDTFATADLFSNLRVSIIVTGDVNIQPRPHPRVCRHKVGATSFFSRTKCHRRRLVRPWLFEILLRPEQASVYETFTKRLWYVLIWKKILHPFHSCVMLPS